MADNKRFFWLKLKEDFFEDETIEWLEEQPNGKEYVLFYLKMCLKSLKHDGKLYREVGTRIIPYDIKKLSENDIIDKFIFDTSWRWNFYYNVFDRLDWNNPDETITESDYMIKKIHIFKFGDEYASICKQTDTSSGNVRSYFIQLELYWGEYDASFSNGKYSSQYWDSSQYKLNSPVTITEIKHQEIWGSAIGKKAEIKEAGYYLKAYSKEAGKITIPAITLQ